MFFTIVLIYILVFFSVVFVGYNVYRLLFLQAQLDKSIKIIYRKKYLKLVKRLEQLVLRLNHLNQVILKIKDFKLLEQYESFISLIENILIIMSKVKPFDTDLQILNSVNVLITEGEKRIYLLHKIFLNFLQNNKKVLNDKTAFKEIHIPIGCYFCSRPFPYNGFSNVRIKIDGMVKEVYSCDVCKHTLEKDKSVKVLFFIKDGKPLHWSEVKEYNPIKSYWDLNNPQRFMKTTKLELIKTNNHDKFDNK